MHSSNRLSSASFTLIELLTVMAVICILAALLSPTLTKARDSARNTACKNILRQYAAATLMYGNDFSDFFPDARTALLPSSGFPSYFTLDSDGLSEKFTRCPGDTGTDALRRLARYETPTGKTVRVSIGGCNLTDSEGAIGNGKTMYMAQTRNMVQNTYPSRRCQWTDYQHPAQTGPIRGAVLALGRGNTPSDSFGEYVYRHPKFCANAAFADGHLGVIQLTQCSATDGGHTPLGTWFRPSNSCYPYGPRNIYNKAGEPDITLATDHPCTRYE